MQFHSRVIITGKLTARIRRKERKMSGSPQGEFRNFVSQGMGNNSKISTSKDRKSHGKMIGRMILILLTRKDLRLYILPKTAW